MAKGGEFERVISKQLSLWWTNGQNDAIFWRSSQSGGRATTREKQGKKTKGQYGDISVTDPVGQPLLDLVSLELKKGYNSRDLMPFIDAKKVPKGSLAEFYAQASRDGARASAHFWWLIHKRDRKETLLHAPLGFFHSLERIDKGIYFPSSLILSTPDRKPVKVVAWDSFLERVDARVVRQLWRKKCTSKS
jgi:hypothetical protein